jgi:hypothetical protein
VTSNACCGEPFVTPSTWFSNPTTVTPQFTNIGSREDLRIVEQNDERWQTTGQPNVASCVRPDGVRIWIQRLGRVPIDVCSVARCNSMQILERILAISVPSLFHTLRCYGIAEGSIVPWTFSKTPLEGYLAQHLKIAILFHISSFIIWVKSPVVVRVAKSTGDYEF